MTDRTGDVLADIDAAPGAPPGARRRLTQEEVEQIASQLRVDAQRFVTALREAFGPDSEFAKRLKVVTDSLQATARVLDTQMPPELRVRQINVKLPAAFALDPRRAAALEALRSRSTGPTGPRLDGRRST